MKFLYPFYEYPVYLLFDTLYISLECIKFCKKSLRVKIIYAYTYSLSYLGFTIRGTILIFPKNVTHCIDSK